MNFTTEDIQQIQQRGSNQELIEKQFDKFATGFPPVQLIRPATVDDGIIRFTPEEMERLKLYFETAKKKFILQKFIPASGAASRMFKTLFELKENPSANEKQQRIGMQFLQDLPRYAFYEPLREAMHNAGCDIANTIAQHDYRTVIHFLLDNDGLGYGNKPKGVLLFHRYENKLPRTPIEEHLTEAALYACNHDRRCMLHFTVSPQHIPLFKQLISSIKDEYEKLYNVSYEISYSIQDPATDTLAATLDNLPYRNSHGQLLFRPGGHGALIHNLGQLTGDIIFIKNIDNVTTEDKLAPTSTYKKILAALLMETVERCHHYLKQYEQHGNSNTALIEEIIAFAHNKLNINIENTEDIPALLNRPIRVCGMVCNEGDPGGGPFWVQDSHGKVSLQIVESSQINNQDHQQESIARQATHFNPVDIVCCIRDYRGQAFDLTNYIDPDTGFIASKTDGDRQLKAMELPGLWNGAMAHWITLFVEVPYSTFNPVKTIFDLLKR